MDQIALSAGQAACDFPRNIEANRLAFDAGCFQDPTAIGYFVVFFVGFVVLVGLAEAVRRGKANSN